MTFSEIEQIFNRAFVHAFSRKKLIFMFPVLTLCGLFVVFCRALSSQAGEWVVLSLNFLPFFLCSGLLLAAGVVLTRIYHNELKGLKVSFRKILGQSWDLLVGVSYLSLPLILIYLLLWMMIGVFYFIKELPAIGEFLNVILAFGPFVLVLGALTLCVFSLMLLFFVTPHVAFTGSAKEQVAKAVIKHFMGSVFSNVILFIIALVPIAFVVGLLSLAASLTGATFMVSGNDLAIAMQWFFIMIPFCAVLAPCVIFFFNFAVESYAFLHKKVIEVK